METPFVPVAQQLTSTLHLATITEVGRFGRINTASAPASIDSAPVCTNGGWVFLQLVNVAKKIKPSTMLSSNVQPIDVSMDCTAWRIWMMRQLIGC